MSPPPGATHSDYQSQILLLLARLMPVEGYPRTECPLQTKLGVKGIDVVWMSRERRAQKPKNRDLYLMAPELCVEVISPKNKRGEIEEKRQLYFEKGAVECWTCDRNGKMAFYDVTGPISRSRLCPNFPARLEKV
ncbi:MAG: Uma2 family endonuclease [Verrucomicrobia bacterium]|nr:Uma2 family endonuclease [Verrucomicrobiota bacterium]MBV9658584.1 Uma2 family endonuclease [Verrucomicrobiota bacterium]